MPRRPSKDVNQIAFLMRERATEEARPTVVPTPEDVKLLMSALGKIGGSKGGKARAKNLSKSALAAIGKKGATARWGSKKRKRVT